MNLLKNETSLRLMIVERLHEIIDILCRFFLIVMVLSVSYVVFGRFILNRTPGWGEELGLFCMIWFSLLSVSMAFIDQRHLKMNLMEILFKERKLKLLSLITYIVLLGFSVFMIIYGMKVTQLTWPTRMPGMQVSRGLLYLSVPVSGFFNTLILILKGKEYLW